MCRFGSRWPLPTGHSVRVTMREPSVGDNRRIRARLALSEPWDWNPPTVELEIDPSDVVEGWPIRCRITWASCGEPVPGCVHPHLPNGPEGLVGQAATLKLRHHHDVPPLVEDRPSVYLMVVVPEIRSPVLIGYGGLQVLGT